MGIFVGTWAFVKTVLTQKKKVVMENVSIFLPSPSFHPQEIKKSH
jgi:hypothetical protein